MSERLATWPATWRDDVMPYPCAICTSPCNEKGWVWVEAISTGFCRCCIAILVMAAPDVARAVLTETARTDPASP